MKRSRSTHVQKLKNTLQTLTAADYFAATLRQIKSNDDMIRFIYHCRRGFIPANFPGVIDAIDHVLIKTITRSRALHQLKRPLIKFRCEPIRFAGNPPLQARAHCREPQRSAAFRCGTKLHGRCRESSCSTKIPPRPYGRPRWSPAGNTPACRWPALPARGSAPSRCRYPGSTGL